MENLAADISTKFFDNLWPLILHNSDYDIQSSNKSEYIIPKQRFDHIWAHELLASNYHVGYDTPIELKCNQSDSDKQFEVLDEEEIKQRPYYGDYAKILPLDQQLAVIQQDVEMRKKLAKNFANREIPWYIQQPSNLHDFIITHEDEKLFKQPLQYQILKGVQYFRCPVMIIDVAPAVPLKNLEHWLKFASYVAIITILHDRELYRKVKEFNYILQPVLMEENAESTWHGELNRSLDVGVRKAKELFLLDNISKSFVFVFSENRGTCAWDKFKILRKS